MTLGHILRHYEAMANSGKTGGAMATVPSGSVHPIAHARMYGVKGRPDAVSLGTIIWLASELMFFAALFAAYFTVRSITNAMATAGEPTLWESGTSLLNFPFAATNTLILVLSSVTCQLGVHAAEHGRVRRSGSLADIKSWGMREWYTLTFVMGSVFIGGQAWEYATLVHEGAIMSTDAYFSLFYLATGFHGLHVLGGLVAFLFMMGRTYLARVFTHEQAVSAVVVSYYWHFVDVVWIILFAALYIIK